MPLGPFSNPFPFRPFPIRVEPFHGFRNERRVLLTARALRSPRPDFTGGGFLANLKVMARLYLSREVASVPITLVLPQDHGEPLRRTLFTDGEGYARFDVPLEQPWPRPGHTRWDQARLEWDGDNGPDHAIAHILAPGRAARYGVISDIDDTILETGITTNIKSIARNWKRVAAQMPHQRRAVEGAAGLFTALAGSRIGVIGQPGTHETPPAHERPVFYVSSSPWNLFAYLGEFKRLAQMPFGPALLRDWGFNRKTLGAASHGTHKIDAIARIAELYEDLPFVLVGDDTQKDLVAFGALARSHPERVAAILIRQISAEPLIDAEHEARATIESARLPLWMGKDFDEAHAFLRKQGLITG